MFFKRYFCFSMCLMIGHSFFSASQAQEITDTTRVHLLKPVEVQASRRPSSFKANAPLQILQADELAKINALQVSDAVKFFAGVQVKDYGGIGGLKTVSIRGLGSAHSLVAYDGLAISDYQTGQIDVGRFSLENIEMLSLNIGESDDIFRSARDLSAVGLLNITTRRPVVDDKKKMNISAGVKSGSFGLFNPAVSYEQLLNKAFRTRISCEWMQTAGNYPYTTTIGEKKTRENSDVKTFNAEANLFGNFSNGGRLAYKMYVYDSDRSLPGAYRFYTVYPGEQAKDRTFLSQAVYEQELSSALRFRSAVKFTDTHTDYTDFNSHYNYLFDQKEYYATATFLYHPGKYFSVSWANDGSFCRFRKNFFDKKPERTVGQSAVSAKYERDAFTLNGSIYGIYSSDHIQSGDTKDVSDWSPYLGFSVKPFKNIPWRMRGFYKRSFRQPTFGDLYSGIFSKNLKAEKAGQYDLGMTWANVAGKYIPYLSFTVDAYWNRIHDKIVAIPVASMYVFTIQNIGKVDIKGIDFRLNMNGYINERFSCQFQASYSYQQALDKTEPGSAIFNQQIPYTPKHTVSGYVAFMMPWFNVNYTLMSCGERYFNSLNRPEYRMDSYTDHGVSADKTVRWKNTNLKFSVECLNVFNQSYEVVRSYPMPGRSFRLALKIIY